MIMNTSTQNRGGGGQRQPRELTGRMVLVWLVSFFAIVAGVNAVMVKAAVSTFGGLETANAYQAGVSFANEEAAAQAQQSRHWRVGARLHREQSGAIAVELSARDKADRPLTGLETKVALIHPTDRRFDHAVAMQPDGPGHFRGATTPEPGQWDLIIELSRDGERLFRSRERVILR
jgi:nitrogen fixation protein FixH